MLFVVDSGAGIEQLKNGWADLSGQITSLPGQPDTRFGLLTVGEDGVQTVDFTRDAGVFLAALQEVEVATGDDSWAALLNEAVTGVGWREGTAIKLIIGLADTRPVRITRCHCKRQPRRTSRYISSLLGEMNEQDESIFRDMAQITGGSFLVLDGSGYTLNEWIVQVIAGELAALRSG